MKNKNNFFKRCFTSLISFAIITGFCATPAFAKNANNNKDANNLNNEYVEDLNELKSFLNETQTKIGFDDEKVYTYTTSSGNKYEVKIDNYPSDEYGNKIIDNNISLKSSSKETVEEGKTYTTTCRFRNLDSFLGGQLVTKVTYSVDTIHNDWVYELTGKRTSMTVEPPRTYSVDSYDFDFTIDSGDDIKAEGYATFKTSDISGTSLYVNYYPEVWIYGVGTDTNQIFIIYNVEE